VLTGTFRCVSIAEATYCDGLHVARLVEQSAEADPSPTTFGLATEKMSLLVTPNNLVVGKVYRITIEEAPAGTKHPDSQTRPAALPDKGQPGGSGA
jgi:hypothetical protein